MFNRALALTRKLGFPDVIMPGKEAKRRRGGGDQRPGGFGEMVGGEVTDEGREYADEGGELHECDDIRQAKKDGG